MPRIILTLNAGSSSLKFGAFAKSNDGKLPLTKILSGQISKLLSETSNFSLIGGDGEVIEKISFKLNQKVDPYKEATEFVLSKLHEYSPDIEICTTVHRVVHGGDEFKEAAVINENVLKQIEKFVPLAALHQPYNIKIASYFYNKYKNIKHYACFDTAFHQTICDINRAYAIPIHYMKEGIKRYGFHGLSYKYISSILKDVVGEIQVNKKWVIAHLGSGSSLCAIENKKSVATTMGFSVLDGIPMATRSGELDPAIITFIQARDKLNPEEMNKILYHQSGLLGLSGGLSNDIKTLIDIKAPEAEFAIEVFCYQVSLSIGKMVAALGGCDGIVFTAGVGENSSKIREMITSKLSWLNVKIDEAKNLAGETFISCENSIPVLVIPTNEEYIMAVEGIKEL